MTYTREQPSPEYLQCVELGKVFHATHKTFTGRHVFQSFPLLRQLVQECGTREVLDYGGGKGEQLTYRDIPLFDHKDDAEKHVYPSWIEALEVEEIVLYDPCVPEYETLPTRRFGGVTCTDVLEHIPPQDMPWVLDEMFAFATQWVFATIALFPGKKILGDGTLAHKAIQPVEWWVALWHETAKRHSGILWEIRLEVGISPLTHRRFRGNGGWWEEADGWWQIWKPHEMEQYTENQRWEMEQIAKKQQVAIDPCAFGKKEHT